jgi:uncharacterized protein
VSLLEELADCRAVDHHCHPLLRPQEVGSWSAAFTEGSAPEVENEQCKHAMFYLRSLKDMAALLDCEPDEHHILERRATLGHDELTRLCLHAAHLEALYLDDGLFPGRILPIEWHGQFVRCERLLRVELLAEQCLPDQDKFLHALTQPCIGYKSIAAYRSGLDIEPRHQLEHVPQARLIHKPAVDWVVDRTLAAAAVTGKPVQFHTGFGDPDLDLRSANPLHLRGMIEKHPHAPIVLLHAGYPFCREAGYLASVYPNVHLDFGLAIPFLSVQGMREVLRMAFELVPLPKLLWSSDASRIPELYYLGALWGRRMLAKTLEQCVSDLELTVREAERYGRAILRDNALRLYGEVK